MNTLDIIIIIAYLVTMVVIGVISSRQQETKEDFFLGGKNLGTFELMSLWLSSWIGGAVIVGTAGNAYASGITASWYVIAICFGFLIFGFFFSGRIKDIGDKFEHLTYADLIEDRYDSRTRIITIITTVLANIAYNAGQLVAGGGLIHAFLGWKVSTGIIVAAIVVTVYTAFGGLKAVSSTDSIQTILIVLSLFATIPSVFRAAGGGFSFLKTSLPVEYFDMTSGGLLRIFGFLLSITLTFFTSMDSYTRSFAAKDNKTARNGTLFAVIGTLAISVSVTYLGMAGKVIFPNLAEQDTVIPMIISEILPNGIKGLMLVGIMSALMSTSSISTLSASANISNDIYLRYINEDATEKQVLRVGVLSTIGVGLLSVILSIRMQNIVDILYVAFTINSAGLFLPTISIFFWEKANSKSAFWSMTITLVVVLVWFFGDMFGWGTIFNIDPVWPGLIASILTFIPLTLMTQPTAEDKINSKKYLVTNK